MRKLLKIYKSVVKATNFRVKKRGCLKKRQPLFNCFKVFLYYFVNFSNISSISYSSPGLNPVWSNTIFPF